MPEQQYRVIADRARGDRIDTELWEEGDRLIYEFGPRSNVWLEDRRILVRIERPVPTTDEPWDKIHALTREWRQSIITEVEYSEAVHALLPSSHLPTREQIAEALNSKLQGYFSNDWAYERILAEVHEAADAVLALIPERSRPMSAEYAGMAFDATVPDQSVQVPVSLIEQIAHLLSTGVVVAHSKDSVRFADRFDPSTIRDVTPPTTPGD